MTTLPTRRIGDREVSAIGMGAMTLTQVAGYSQAQAVQTVHAALDAGVTLFDTADSYGPVSGYGANEHALASALRSYRGSLDGVVIATKGGHTRHENGTWWIDGSAAHLAAAARASLARLGLDSIPLYQHHRPDPRRDYKESMLALRQLHDDGIVERVGISNVDLGQLEVAHAILGAALVSVQNEFSPLRRDPEGVLPRTTELGIAFLAWGPLGGMRGAKDLGSALPVFASLADARGVSPQRVAIAWLLSQAPNLIPIPGASRPASILDSVAATRIVLREDELERLDAVSQ